MDPTQTPITDHLEFDRMCSTLEEFEHLPAISGPPLERDELEHDGDGDGDGQLDQLILAGLVSPV